MSVFAGPTISNNGLVFYYDMGNTQKSWKGAPITNVQWNNGSEITPWTVGGQNNDVSSTIGLTAPIPQAKTWEFIKTGTSNQWNGWESNYGGIWTGLSGDYWSVSYWYKTQAPAGLTGFGVGGFANDTWTRYYNVTVVDNVSSIIADGTWHYNYTVVRFNENYSNAIIADGPSWGYSTSAGVLYVNGLCWNKNSYAAPWAAGTRSNTQALLDLTNTNTITAQNLSYASNGTFSFDGTDDTIHCGNISSSFTGDVTVEALVKINASPSDWVRIVGSGGNSGNRTFGLWYSTSRTILWQRYGAADPSILPGTAMDTGVWYHIVATTSGTSHVLYLNNSVIGTAAAAGPWAASGENVTIGFAGFHTYLNGTVPTVKLYNRGLTAQEVAQNFNALRGRYGI